MVIITFAIFAVVVSALIFGITVLVKHNSKQPDIGLSAISKVAYFLAALTIAGGIILVLNYILNDVLTVEVPTYPYWPEIPKDAEIISAAKLEHASFATAKLEISGLSYGIRATLAASVLLQAVATATLLFLFASLSKKVTKQSAFDADSRKLGLAAALLVMITGTVGVALNGFGSSAAGEAALRMTSASWVGDYDLNELMPEPSFLVEFSFVYIGIALAIALVSEILAAGSSLRAKVTQLEQEVDGLV